MSAAGVHTSAQPSGQGDEDMAKYREQVDAFIAANFGLPLPIATVTDLEVPGEDGAIPVRVYRPESEDLLPIMVYIHGGGWCFGSVTSYDPLCRAIAKACDAVVVSVEYRLAPENPHPAGLNDCYTVTSWVSRHAKELGGDSSSLAVAGDSAGGNLAAAVALKARGQQIDGAPHINFQLLICPVLDYHTPGTASYAAFGGDDAIVSRKAMEKVFLDYVPNKEDIDSPLVCPLRAQDLTGLPPALIFTGERDLLRDEGEAYAAKLLTAGVDVSLKRFKGAAHVGMLSPLTAVADYDLSLALIRAHWQHALESSLLTRSEYPERYVFGNRL
ncbi:hypothetical protein WJX75_004465 [Coccomyxa subellipsoidea]|uniref:Alpha/beta hydrolase fold-3 domain-containing protein n=1 Tax=Coccomyxa subellipsoidea TaxID=248742 RepID=A0ABR2Z0J7_9CHLO